MTKIYYNDNDVTNGFIDRFGVNFFFNFFFRTVKNNVHVLIGSFGNGILREGFNVDIDHDTNDPAHFDSISFKSDCLSGKMWFDFYIHLYHGGVIQFSIYPDSIYIDETGPDDKDAVICLYCGKNEMVISLKE